MQAKVTMNGRGVITIPAAFRKAFGLKANDELIVEDSPEGILLRPALSVPMELYSESVASWPMDFCGCGVKTVLTSVWWRFPVSDVPSVPVAWDDGWWTPPRA